jgi:hypothetical protein
MSHDHDVNVSPLVNLDQDERGYVDPKCPGFIKGKVNATRAELIKTNAYIKWGGYSERGGFAPVDLSTPVIWLLSPQSEYWNMVPDRPEKGIRVIA